MGHRTEESLRELILELDSNVDEEVLENTPGRMIDAWHEPTRGYTADETEILSVI